MKTIYGLKDWTGVIRYVGQTKLPLSQRLSLHKSNAPRESRPVAAWVLSEAMVSIVMLEIAKNAAADAAERKWIAALPNLLNVAAGGPGCPGVIPSESTRRKRAESVRADWAKQTKRVRFTLTAEQSRKQKEGCRGNGHRLAAIMKERRAANTKWN